MHQCHFAGTLVPVPKGTECYWDVNRIHFISATGMEGGNDDPNPQERKGQIQSRQLQTYQPHQLRGEVNGTAHQHKAHLVQQEEITTPKQAGFR